MEMSCAREILENGEDFWELREKKNYNNGILSSFRLIKVTWFIDDFLDVGFPWNGVVKG